jgi:Type IX secretion system protein PorV
MKNIMTYACVLVLALGLSDTAFAGAGNRTGTGGATELLIPAGTRDIALGGSTIATTSGISALFWNPAGVAKMNNSVVVYASHMNYIADIGVDYGAVSANVEGFGVLSLSLKALAIDDILVTTTTNPDGTGQTFKPSFLTAGLTYSRQLSDRIAVGLTTNFISETLGDVSASGFAFNVGVIYDNLGSVDGLSLGVVVKNIGPQMKFSGPGLNTQATVASQNRPPQFYKIDGAAFELPSTLEFGIGYRANVAEDNTVLLSSTFQNNNFSDDEYKFGAEYAYQDLLFLRGGYNFAQKESDQRDFIFGATFGAGVHGRVGTLDLTFDYAFRQSDFFDNNHVFSLMVGF